MTHDSTPSETSNPAQPSAITSLVGAVCRVCGARLSPPMVVCPRCESPHHADCWEYNGGCSTYGCREQVPTTVAREEQPPVQVISGADLFLDAWDPRQNRVVASALFLMLLRIVPPPWTFVVLGVAAVVLIGMGVKEVRSSGLDARPEVETESARLLAERTEDSTTLEVKAVRTLINAGFPHALAQSYALLEQRHPRRALESEDQVALAAELAASGYRVLALEALDKADPQARFDPPLELRRDRLLGGELAYAVVPATEDPGTPLTHAPARFRLSAMRKAELAADHRLYLASLSPAGWPWDMRSALLAVGRGDASAVPDRGWLLAGPFEPPRARELLDTLWNAGHPTITLTEQEIALDAALERVTRVKLSQEEAVFATGGKDFTLPWTEITDVFYAIVVQEHKILDRPPQPARVTDLVKPAREGEERTSYRAYIEIHCGRLRRLRIDVCSPEIFRYLGRRLGYVEAENLRLVAKDLVRFAPQARASHGVLSLMMKRLLPGGRFEGEPQLEEYVRWFAALGRASVRQRLGVGEVP